MLVLPTPVDSTHQGVFQEITGKVSIQRQTMCQLARCNAELKSKRGSILTNQQCNTKYGTDSQANSSYSRE